MPKVFILTGKRAGTSCQLMNRYNFIDGVHLEESDDNAKMKVPNLVVFYKCKMMDYEDYMKERSAPVAAATASVQVGSKSAADELMENQE